MRCGGLFCNDLITLILKRPDLFEQQLKTIQLAANLRFHAPGQRKSFASLQLFKPPSSVLA